jgi:hypothetical protein
MLNLEDFIEDKAFEIVIDNLPSVLIEYADEIADDILETFLTTKRDWEALRVTNQSSVHVLLCQLAEWYARDNYTELLEQYQSEVDND